MVLRNQFVLAVYTRIGSEVKACRLVQSCSLFSLIILFTFFVFIVSVVGKPPPESRPLFLHETTECAGMEKCMIEFPTMKTKNVKRMMSENKDKLYQSACFHKYIHKLIS